MKRNITCPCEATDNADESKQHELNDVKRKIRAKARLEESCYRHVYRKKNKVGN